MNQVIRGIGMLKRFEVTNFKGFQDKLVFDLTARDYEFNKKIVKDGIVNKAIVYGKNGIGKSSLGIALFDIISHLTDNRKMKSIYYQNYLNLKSSDKVATFCYYFQFDDDEIVYEYTKTSIDDLVSENLKLNGEELLRFSFEDSYDNFISEKIKGTLNMDLRDNWISIIKYIYKNSPTNSVPAITKMVEFCRKMLWYRSLSDGNDYCGFYSGPNSLDEIIYKSNRLHEFEEFLRENGQDYNLSFRNINGKNVLHAIFNNGEVPFVSVASTGTMALFLFYAWSISFDEISLLFIDEFDAFFHYESAENIIMKLNKAKNFQTILTSHNTYLMQNKITRPDCCFLMTENRITNLINATSKDIREAHNLEKMYINGAFNE